MSSKKRFKSNPMAIEVADTSGSEDAVNIRILPPEIILRILSNLSHGDLLWSRLVCTKWNDVVRTDQNFLQRSLIYVYPNSDNTTGRDILENSSVKWKNLHLMDVNYFGTGRAFPVEVPLYLRGEVQSLKISYSNMSWKGYQHVLTQFPSLKELKIKGFELFGTSGPTKKTTRFIGETTLQPEFEAILNGLSGLSISHCEIPAINVFLNRFQKHLKSLTTFIVKTHAHEDLSVLRMHGADFYQGLYDVIHGNSKSLRKLEITIAELPGGIENRFENVLRRLIESPTASSSLNLDTIYLRYSVLPDELDLQALVTFLKMNKNLKRVCLPEMCILRYARNSEARKTVVQTFMTALPKDIVQVEVPKASYFQAPHNGNLFNFFDKLEVINIHRQVSPSHRLLQGLTSSHVKNFRDSQLRNLRGVQRLTDAFPHLIHLEVTIAKVAFSESILHHISEHMQLLVSLDLTIDAWSEVTDSGVTGIKPSHCKILQSLNPKSLGVMEVPAQQMNGHPLSSLRRLEKLAIICDFKLITDVGLCFGFRFSRLKHLSLINFGREPSITPVGLNYLVDFNKCLERVTLDEIVSKRGPDNRVRTKEIADFKLRLDRCKHFRMNIKLSERTYKNISDVDSNSSFSDGDDFSDSDDSHSLHSSDFSFSDGGSWDPSDEENWNT